MKTPITAAIATIGLLAVSVTASAQTQAAPQADKARPRQQIGQKVRAGVESGQLTKGELTRLRARVAAVRERGKALRTGSTAVTPELRRGLRRQWRQVNRMIFRLKHNRIHR